MSLYEELNKKVLHATHRQRLIFKLDLMGFQAPKIGRCSVDMKLRKIVRI
jgi:hypothetical protein